LTSLHWTTGSDMTVPPGDSTLPAAVGTRAAGAGFTLIEAIIGMTILVWFIAGLCLAGARVSTQLEAQREVVTASQSIQERTEAIRSTSFSDLTNATFVQSTLLSSATNSAGNLHSPVEVLTISSYPPDASPPLRATRQQATVTLNSSNPALTGAAAVRVDVQISWLSQNGHTRSRQISTLVANGGINR
jgi:Tfp pilus assembly protein PilV